MKHFLHQINKDYRTFYVKDTEMNAMNMEFNFKSFIKGFCTKYHSMYVYCTNSLKQTLYNDIDIYGSITLIEKLGGDCILHN